MRENMVGLIMSHDLARASLCFLLLFFFAVADHAAGIDKTFSVIDFGAVADGKSDSTQAFTRAWDAACGWEGNPRLVIPAGAFLVGPVKFKGPCKGRMAVQVNGLVLATTDLAAYPTTDWIAFQYVDGLVVTGGGRFDGQGASAWPHNGCSKQKKCDLLPTSIKFSFINNGIIRGISSVNSKLFHVLIFACKNMQLESIRIAAPADSPNTDGIHIAESTNITVARSTIGTGDDCISMGSGNTNVSISEVSCGPGHGISVGSLGRTPGEGNVVGLWVRNCTLTGTSNGIRIKTWEDSPAVTVASDLTFEDIVIENVENPIIIDQEYCPHNACSKNSPSKVRISNIKFRNIRGTSATKVAVNLLCSKGEPCRNVELDNIDLEYHGRDGAATASCTNAKGISIGRVVPPSCL